VALTRDENGRCEIDNFLLSCRVIGRTVETAILAQIAHEARERGNTLLTGWFLPSAKNAPAKDFYKSHGFSVAAERPEGTLWERTLSDAGPQCPPWIKLSILQGEVPA
jgi:predicted enzyme involved in methoxymalonyl-ACP biosynthesis